MKSIINVPCGLDLVGYLTHFTGLKYLQKLPRNIFCALRLPNSDTSFRLHANLSDLWPMQRF